MKKEQLNLFANNSIREQLTEKLHNYEFTQEISKELQEIAKKNNLVIVFAFNHNWLVCYGAINIKTNNTLLVSKKEGKILYKISKGYYEQVDGSLIIGSAFCKYEDNVYSIDFFTYKGRGYIEKDDLFRKNTFDFYIKGNKGEGLVFSLDEME